jgi:hypothetical protein
MKTIDKKTTIKLTTGEQSACDTIRPMMNENSVHDATAKYLIGTEVAELKNAAGKYGKASVPRVARSLGCTRVLLDTYARVADAWTSEEFTALTDRKNAKGVSLTFTHYIAISNLDTKEARAELLEDALKNSLTTRQTEWKVAGPSVEKTATLGKRVANVAKVVARSEGADATPELLAELEAAAVQAAAAKEELAAMMATVNERIADVKRALATPVSTPNVGKVGDVANDTEKAAE